MKIKSVLSNKNLNSGIYFRAILANIKNPKALSDLIFTYRNYQYQKKYKSDSLNEMLYEFTFGGSLQELLRYSDRNSMAHSVEVRLPFLDHKLVEFVFSLPARFKVNNGFSKYILRSAIDNKLLDQITWRKDKIGYEPPNKSIIKGTSLNKYLIDEISL
jgi:asparagine synthase (glutamine-hydrolysing)